ncbi:hypothetical protein PCANC_02265 [Puccinia coronata f. sp. avenae]|uniref:NADH-ubiquinone oxidoreductase 9.5 kDa subunit n=1 Tax=Puccinia coronata f. sp. avenae TaxID=200324 RepID=A0A2N5W0V0_9BASI|nr:hypothetical protein PCANC_16325 [Puccinia coronata f. sp. avenae]PLW55881.1 hypothetical protein PCANC_02265 [Puccinia coronata f. sp. avenae]
MSSASAIRLSRFQKFRRYMQYQAHENPAIFWSVAIGAAGPVLLATVPPIRRNYFGYVSPDPIPMSYPLPQRKRNTELKGYDD